MSGSRIERVAILTGGGDCPGLNAVIRAFVKTADRFFGWEIVGILDGFEGLFRSDATVSLTSESVRGLLPQGGTILGTSNRGDPFRQRQVVDGEVRVLDRSREAVERLETLGTDALVVVGGDGSLTTGLELHQLGVPVVGVPKTIDNDISATDLTFGFDTAVRTATDAIDKLQSTAASHHRVMILEVMGRHAGWIALEAGLAGGVEVILIPEIPFRLVRIVEHLRERHKSGRNFSLIVVAEGACPMGGAPIVQGQRDPHAPVRLGGVGPWLAAQLGELIDHEVRATVLGHLQRGGSPSPSDRVLATRLGSAAAWLVGHGDFGKMVALRRRQIVPITLAEAVHRRKTVAPFGEDVMTARCLGISFGD
jgi:phosphofructokinase-like protein